MVGKAIKKSTHERCLEARAAGASKAKEARIRYGKDPKQARATKYATLRSTALRVQAIRADDVARQVATGAAGQHRRDQKAAADQKRRDADKAATLKKRAYHKARWLAKK
jgi:hypothetical protein